MRFVGFSEFYHDAAFAIVGEDGIVEYATQAERLTKKKNDSVLPDEIWDIVTDDDHVSFYEDHELKINTRHGGVIPTCSTTTLKNDGDQSVIPFPDSIVYDAHYQHHQSHVATAFYTRPWNDSNDTVLVSIDGVGEIQSAVIYSSDFKLLHEWQLPVSVGMAYTAVTRMLGLRPLEDEYVVMGLASYGEPILADRFIKFWNETPKIGASKRLWNDFLGWLKREYHDNKVSDEDLAASVQEFADYAIMQIMHIARQYGSKLCYSGGCAQNVVINSKIHSLFNDVHIAIAPTDSGSALGAAARSYHLHSGNDKVIWTPYLGDEITTDVNPREVAKYLISDKVCGLAHGRAEFGPRALGNRSLIADVRYDVKDTVNEIKRRQKYRPFAPAILEEFADQYFEGPMNEYMQFTSKALHDYKSVTHVDGTARVQVVKKDCPSIFRKVIEEYYELTGVPMLLNTSLNIRGRPMVNDRHDADLFEQKYGVKVW